MDTDFVQTGSVRLQTFSRGHGPHTIVLVHGYRMSGRVWQLVQEALDADRFRTIAICNRGAADSDRTPGEDSYTFETFAADLWAAVQCLGLRDFTLVGHSMGGLTVTQFALAHQDVLTRLVLVDPASLDGRTRASARGTAGSSDIPEGKAPPEFLAALEADIARNPPERLSAGPKSMGSARLRQRLGELRLPVLVMAGDQDTLVGLDNILAEYAALPAPLRNLHVIHGAGHSPNVERPLEVAAVLDRFVSDTALREG